MSEDRGGAPPGWAAFTVRATILSGLIFAIALVPFRAWIGDDGIPTLAFGAGLSLGLISLSYWVLAASFRSSAALQQAVILGGFLARLALVAGTVLAIWSLTALHRGAVVASVMIFYLPLLFYEAKVIWDLGTKR